MAETDGKRIGRPKRAPGETMVRLSVSITGSHREKLVRIAKQHWVSLSQALEFAIDAYPEVSEQHVEAD